MKRTTAAALMIAGAMCLGGSVHYHKTRFSSSNIWERQRPIVSKVYRRDPAKRAQIFKELRTELNRLDQTEFRDTPASAKGADSLTRCKAEKRFEAIQLHKGNVPAADEALSQMTFDGNLNCGETDQLGHTATRWFSVVGAALETIGLIGLIRTFRRRRDGVPPADAS